MHTVSLAPQEYRLHLEPGYQLLEKEGFTLLHNDKNLPVTAGEMASWPDDLAAVVAGGERWDAAAMDRFPGLRIIAKCGVGVDNIDLNAAKQRGIVVTNAPGVNSNAVAEVAIALMISVMRQIPRATEAAKAGETPILDGPELAGKTVGLIGFGRIGRTILRRLSGFELTFLVHDPFLGDDEAALLGVRAVSLAELLSNADIVSLHAPHTAETHHLIGAEALAQMRRGSYLINTARGGLVDEDALFDALQDGQLAGAALDVFEHEPVPKRHKLLQLPTVVGTTHLAANSVEASSAVALVNARAVISVLAGEEPANRIV